MGIAPPRIATAWSTLLMNDDPWSVTSCFGIPVRLNSCANFLSVCLPLYYRVGWPLGTWWHSPPGQGGTCGETRTEATVSLYRTPLFQGGTVMRGTGCRGLPRGPFSWCNCLTLPAGGTVPLYLAFNACLANRTMYCCTK